MSTTQAARDKAVQRLFDALVLLGRTVNAHGSDWADVDPELSRGDIHTLGVIASSGPCRPGHVAEKLCVDRSVVSRLLATLAQHDLVERAADPDDGRAELVSLTEAGRQRLLRARDLLCSALGERLEPWDAAGIGKVAGVLEELTRRLHDPLVPVPTKEGNV
jgi:DNA-binding MarR family transcriptional regulator